MADSDDEYIQDAASASDDPDLSMAGVDDLRPGASRSHGSGQPTGRESGRTRDGKKGKGKRKVAGQARWEASAQSLGFQEGADGRITGGLERDLEAMKRARLKKDTTPLQRGIIRHLILVLDLSDAMSEKDFKPTRYLLTLRYTLAYIREFFEQNPISQLALVGMRDGLARPISDLSGNPTAHLTAVRELLAKASADAAAGNASGAGQGSPSLQNALEMSCAMLQGAPSHGTREVVVVLGALLTSDPGDIYATIRRCARERLRVSVIGLGARLYICGEIVSRTNGGDDSGYGVAVDETSLRDLLMATTTPPEIRGEGGQGPSALASLLKMGFPNRIAEEVPSLCACHNKPVSGGYQCPQCMVKYALGEELSSPFSAEDVGGKIPSQEKLDKDGDVAMAEANGSVTKSKNAQKQKDGQKTKDEGVSESRRYECETCQNHFCIDCDVFCHDVLHNCPGCQSQAHLPGAQVENAVENAVTDGQGHEDG
ncbi:MAG: hypothetical protein M1822_004453 [Bathelium mastoideum]|nr:MAG: hypothetical protein M1822_004453 [Bathelium mastoideum]